MVLVLASVFVWVRPHAAPADLVDAFRPVFSVNTAGSVVLRGNANLTCDTVNPACAGAKQRTGAGGALNNNAYKMVHVDVDGEMSFNSSAAELTLPPGASVLYAGLFWGGDTFQGTGRPAPDPAARDRVRFKTPGGAYRTVTASTFSEVTTFVGHSPYQGYADVSGLVAGAGGGTYTVADIQAATAVQDRYAAWSLVVVVHDPAQPVRNLVVYDGFGAVRAITPADATVTIPVTGFQTPPTGTVTTTLGAVAYEGDGGSGGDSMTLNNTPVQDALSPAGNFFNSTISDRGVAVTARAPADTNLFGVDIDHVDASGILANGDRSATITLQTTPGTGETFYPGAITFATDLYAPRLTATKTAIDVNGGTVRPGDEIRYTVQVGNDGLAPADDTRVADAVPPGTGYVPGSLSIDGGTLSDQVDADRAEFGAGIAVFRVGTGSGATTGGSIPVGGSVTVGYSVTVDAAALSAATLLNVAHVAYLGAGTGLKLRTLSNATLQTLGPVDTADLTVTAGAPPAGPGGAVLVPVTLTNTGPDPATGAVLTAVLPAGVTVTGGTLSPGSGPGTCTVAGQTLTCTVGTLAAGGTVTVDVAATVTPGAAPAGVVSVTATAATQDPNPADNTATAPLGRNTAPAAAPDTATAGTGATVDVPVLANDTDPDGDTPRVLGIATPPAGGHAVVTADGTVRYTAGAAAGPDTFSYTVGDGRGGTATATVTVTVTAGPAAVAGPPPVAVADLVVLAAGERAATFDVLANDTGPGGPGTLTVAGTTTPTGGTVVLTPAGRLTYTARPGFRGVDSFQYTVTDGHGGTGTATVTVTVPDRAPVAVADVRGTPADTAIDVDVLGNDSDPDTLDPLTVTGFDAVSARGGTVTAGAGGLRYTPRAGFSGIDTFTYTAADGDGGTATGTVTVHVGADRRPVPQSDAAGTATGTPVTVAVLANDTDPDGAPLTVAAVGPGAYGTAVLDGAGTVTYTPRAGFSGIDTFTYAVADRRGGLRAATVTVTVFNAVPAAADDVLSTPAGTTATLPVLGGDTDANGDALRVVAATGATHGTLEVLDGEVRYTPAAGYRGPDAFTYTVSDGNGGTATAAVALTVTNRAPLTAPDTAATPSGTAATVAVLGNDTDPDGDLFAVSAVGTAGHGSAVLDTDGTVTYTPAAGFAGLDTFTYTVTDAAGGQSTGTVTVTVAAAVTPPAVTPPPVTPPPAVTLPPAVAPPAVAPPGAATSPVVVGTPMVTTPTGDPQTIAVLNNVHDPDGDPLRVPAVTQPGHGSAVLNSNGTVTYTPDAGFAGADSFAYTATDGTTTVTGTVELMVGAVDLPTTGAAAAPHALAGILLLVLGWVLRLAPGLSAGRAPVSTGAGRAPVVSAAGPRPGSRASARTTRRRSRRP